MKILKHGNLANGNHVDLIGRCENCGCKFKTFVDIFPNKPEEGAYIFRTDPDCCDMKIDPHFVCWDQSDGHWDGYKWCVAASPRFISSVDYSIKCPECRVEVTLKEITK